MATRPCTPKHPVGAGGEERGLDSGHDDSPSRSSPSTNHARPVGPAGPLRKAPGFVGLVRHSSWLKGSFRSLWGRATGDDPR